MSDDESRLDGAASKRRIETDTPDERLMSSVVTVGGLKSSGTRVRLEESLDLLETGNRQVVLARPPGTSKTWIAELLATYLLGVWLGTGKSLQG